MELIDLLKDNRTNHMDFIRAYMYVVVVQSENAISVQVNDGQHKNVSL